MIYPTLGSPAWQTNSTNFVASAAQELVAALKCIEELNHEAENQANRIQELEDKLAAAHKAMAAGEALARAVMLDQTGEG